MIMIETAVSFLLFNPYNIDVCDELVLYDIVY